MSEVKKPALGVLTVLANLFILSFLLLPVFFFGMLETPTNPSNVRHETAGILFQLNIWLVSFGFFLGFGLFLYYVNHITNNQKINRKKYNHVKWILFTFLGFTFGQFIYWYLKIWKEPEEYYAQTQ